MYIGKTPDLNVESLCAEDPGVSSENAVELLCSRRMEAAYLTVLLPGEFRKLEICQVLLNNGKYMYIRIPSGFLLSQSLFKCMIKLPQRK